jgi:hypothetical protein
MEMKRVEEEKLKKKLAKKADKLKNARQRRIKRKMGIVRYYLCFCLRYRYDDSVEELTEEEKAERDRKIALARRMAELAVKNPVTAPWRKFEKKIDPVKGQGEKYVIEKHDKTERPREERRDNRADRRNARKHDEDLRMKPRATVSGVDI